MNVLASFFYCAKNQDLWDVFFREARKRDWKILIDSGAFSAFWAKSSIDLDAYCRFLHERKAMLWDYIALDVVNNSKASLMNYKRMRLRRLSPMAVLTEDMSVDVLPDLIELTGNERVCMAGGTRWPMQSWMARCKLAQQHAPQARVHSLGFTRSSGPWRSGAASVDSSTWVNGNRFGSLATFDLNGITQHASDKLAKTKVQDWPVSVRNILLTSGVQQEDLKLRTFQRCAHSGRHLITCEAWMQFAERSEEMGCLFFFATTDPRQLLPDMAAAHALRSGAGWHEAQRIARRALASIKARPQAGCAWAMDLIDEAQRMTQPSARVPCAASQADLQGPETGSARQRRIDPRSSILGQPRTAHGMRANANSAP